MSQMRVLLTALVALMALGLVGCGSDERPVSAKQEKAIAERLAPEGQVSLEGETGSMAAVSASSEPRTGEEIFNTKCMICHATGTGGAPMLGKIDQWTARIGQGIDVLYANAINGVRGMPGKGLCMDCSDEELNATVDYMVAKSQ